MTITIDLKESLNDLGEKYFKVVKLIKEDSKTDPPTDPFLSKFAAKQILIPMKATLQNLLKNQTPNSPEQKRLTAMLGIVHIFLGTIYIEMDEFQQAQQSLEKTLELTEEFKDEPHFVSIAMNAYNQLGILYFQKDAEKAKVYCDKSVCIYEQNKNNLNPPPPMDSLFDSEIKEENTEEDWEKFETIHTATLYYLAQIYGNLKDALKSAVYCHMTLKRQLVYKKYESIDWALNAATLSQFFAEQTGFKQARHHLSASSYILDRYKEELDSIEVKDEMFQSKMEEFNHRSADVARCWVQYCSLLLSKSKERLLAEVDKDDPDYIQCTFDLADLNISNSTVSKEDLSNLFFPSLDLAEYESKISDKYVLTLSEAKAVFLCAQNWIGKSQVYYSLESLASDFIQITLSHCQLYNDLLFFDDNPDNRAKYYKRIIDLSEDLLGKVNSQYYLYYCRKMWYETGTTYIDLLDIKMDKQRESDARPSAHSLSKINSIISKALKHYTTFIESFQNKNVPEDYYMSYARSQFYIGVLNGKFFTLDKKKQLENTETSYEAYKKVIAFCDEHPGANEKIKVEFGVCKEMVELLPVKIQKLKSMLPQEA